MVYLISSSGGIYTQMRVNSPIVTSTVFCIPSQPRSFLTLGCDTRQNSGFGLNSKLEALHSLGQHGKYA